MIAQLKNHFKNLDAILISSRANIVYLTSYSGFYETERECFLLITKNRQYIITDQRYSGSIKRDVKDFSLIETGANNFISKNAKELFKKEGIKILGFEADNITVSEYTKLRKFAKLKSIDLSNLRIIKTGKEIENIKKACGIGDLAFDFILDKLKTGVSEKEIANEMEQFIKSKNTDISFSPLVAFGKNAAIPHHKSGNNKLKSNTIVLLDFGVKVNNYCSDMSRTVFVGIATTEFKRIHQTVLEAQTKAIKSIKANMKASRIDKVARDYIVKQGYPNIIHSVGHGIGIEVHESPHLSPNSKDVIKQGMVFSVEPGIYIPSYGGVRIEDLVLVTYNGPELISHANRNIIEI